MPREDEDSLILKAIANAGAKGALQCALRKKLRMSDKKISRLVIKLEKRGQVKRAKELHAKRWTYRLFITKQPTTFDSILDLPCTACPSIDQCGTGKNVSPVSCELLGKWLDNEVTKQQMVGSNAEEVDSGKRT